MTIDERIVLEDVARRTLDCMVWDNEANEYRGDYENWIIVLSKEEMEILKSAIDKL